MAMSSAQLLLILYSAQMFAEASACGVPSCVTAVTSHLAFNYVCIMAVCAPAQPCCVVFACHALLCCAAAVGLSPPGPSRSP